MTNLAEQLTYLEASEQDIIQIGNISFNSNLHMISSDNKSLYLRHQLNSVLLLLIQNINRGISREDLINKVWNGNKHTGQKALTHSICKLRQILESLTSKNLTIYTIPKFGYSLIRL